MQLVELNTKIDAQGNIHLPEEYQDFYGKEANLIVRLQEQPHGQLLDPMQFSGTIPWPSDGMEYQRQIRAEWE